MAGVGQWLKSKFTPPSLEDMERETRKWVIECKTCGKSNDLWEAGGTRYKATGNKSVLGRCTGCDNRLRMMKIYRSVEAHGN